MAASALLVTMKHLILVGACYLDTILSLPSYPQEDSKLRASDLKIRRGGNCPNTMEVILQLLTEHDEVTLYLVSVLPSRACSATESILSSFQGNKAAKFEHCIHREDHATAASAYILRSQETGSRTIINYNDLPEMTVDEFRAIAQDFSPSQDTWWHFEGRIPNTTKECIQIVHQLHPDAPVSIEIENPGRAGLEELAGLADVVFYSRAWAQSRQYKSAQECLKGEGLQSPTQKAVSLCTWGEEGAALYKRPDGDLYQYSAKETGTGDVQVIDSVGAGDVFIAGILYAFLCRGTAWSHRESLMFAVNLATKKVQQEGFSHLGEVCWRPL
ncbi:Ribokinase-like protein [Stachybotrys elegans]|uniref:Ribokinase-like protein n=1 Tax=Stachybotrys elegans TaxID=80388 RepID=A0A8K0SWU3_9HYPO|nr:Ribokinase-like protein [Stachybotrys elegans]